MMQCRCKHFVAGAAVCVPPLLLLLVLLLLASFGTLCNGKTLSGTTTTTPMAVAAATPAAAKQLLFDGAQGKETNTPNFVRLVMMRLIYGLASTMGLEERLEGAFNGIFVPPNADEGDFFGGGDGDGDGGANVIQLFGGGDDGGGDLLEGLFDADY